MVDLAFRRRLICSVVCVILCVSALVALLVGPVIHVATISAETHQSTTELGERVGEGIIVGIIIVGIAMAALSLWETLNRLFAATSSNTVCCEVFLIASDEPLLYMSCSA